VVIAAGAIIAAVGIVVLLVRWHSRSSVDSRLEEIDGELMQLQQKMAPPPSMSPPPQQQQQQPAPVPTMAYLLLPPVRF